MTVTGDSSSDHSASCLPPLTSAAEKHTPSDYGATEVPVLDTVYLSLTIRPISKDIRHGLPNGWMAHEALSPQS
jgi:hypothetical protein